MHSHSSHTVMKIIANENSYDDVCTDVVIAAVCTLCSSTTTNYYLATILYSLASYKV